MSEAIVFTSGKGGVGKTTVLANVGVGLSQLDKKVVMLDTDMGLRNLDLLLGLENRIVYTIVDVIEERCKLKQALVKDKKNPNLSLLAAAQTRDKTAVNAEQLKGICDTLKEEITSYKLLLNRVRPNLIKNNEMMSVDDVVEILSCQLIGIIPEDTGIITSTNKGEPIVNDENALAGKAYRNVAQRILGEEVPFLDLDEPKGIVAKIKNVFAKLKAKV